MTERLLIIAVLFMAAVLMLILGTAAVRYPVFWLIEVPVALAVAVLVVSLIED